MSDSLAFTKNDCDCIQWRASVHEAVGKKYVPGNYDCSKFVEEVYCDCGIWIQRCRAIDYAYGRCGFDSMIATAAATCDMIFWDWPDKSGGYKAIDDPDGLDIQHVGIAKSTTEVYHNSSTKRHVVIGSIKDGSYLKKYIKVIRRPK